MARDDACDIEFWISLVLWIANIKGYIGSKFQTIPISGDSGADQRRDAMLETLAKQNETLQDMLTQLTLEVFKQKKGMSHVHQERRASSLEIFSSLKA